MHAAFLKQKTSPSNNNLYIAKTLRKWQNYGVKNLLNKSNLRKQAAV